MISKTEKFTKRSFGMLGTLFQRKILTHNAGQTDLFSGIRLGFINKSVHSRLQVSVSSGYDLFHFCC